MNRQAALLLVLPVMCSLAIAGCGLSVTPTLEPPGFDLAAVKVRFAGDCKDNAKVGTWFCDTVQLDRMTAAGSVLTVPTSLWPKTEVSRVSSAQICGWFAGTRDLGYEVIGILDKNGRDLTTCPVVQ